MESSGKHERHCPIVVLLGSLSGEPAPLDAVAREFGWALESVMGIAQLRDLSVDRNLVAVLFEPEALGMASNQALRLIREAAPKALPILCQRLSEPDVWPELAEAGAFHSLPLPLNAGEVKQSLGFVWAAKRQRAGNGRLHGPAAGRRRRLRLERTEAEMQASLSRSTSH